MRDGAYRGGRPPAYSLLYLIATFHFIQGASYFRGAFDVDKLALVSVRQNVPGWPGSLCGPHSSRLNIHTYMRKSEGECSRQRRVVVGLEGHVTTRCARSALPKTSRDSHVARRRSRGKAVRRRQILTTRIKTPGDKKTPRRRL